jgi:hypothetical protein
MIEESHKSTQLKKWKNYYFKIGREMLVMNVSQ